MPLGHKLCGPRWVVLPHDTSVDQDKSDAAKYRESRYRDGLVLVDGAPKPTRFLIGPLTTAQKRQALAVDGETGYLLRCGLLEIENFLLEDEDGNPKEIKQPDRRVRGVNGECASESWVEGVVMHERDKAMLAAMIWEITEARPLSCSVSDKLAGDTSSNEKESTE